MVYVLPHAGEALDLAARALFLSKPDGDASPVGSVVGPRGTNALDLGGAGALVMDFQTYSSLRGLGALGEFVASLGLAMLPARPGGGVTFEFAALPAPECAGDPDGFAVVPVIQAGDPAQAPDAGPGAHDGAGSGGLAGMMGALCDAYGTDVGREASRFRAMRARGGSRPS